MILIILGLLGFFLYLAMLGLGLWDFIYALPTSLPPLELVVFFLWAGGGQNEQNCAKRRIRRG